MLAAIVLSPAAAAAAPDEEGHEIPFRLLASGYSASIATPAFVQARNAQDLEWIWRLYANSSTSHRAVADPWPWPQVDFGSHMVVAFFYGRRDDEGNPLHFTRVLEYPERITLEIVHVIRRDEPDNPYTCGGFVHVPWFVIEIPRTLKPVDYTVTSQVTGCMG